MKKFSADFETITRVDDCRVWAYGICELGKPESFIYGNNIEDFIKFCANPKENYLMLFHNLKFDGEFIFSYLLNNGFTCIKDKKDKATKTFTTLISDTGQFYSIEIFFEVRKGYINKVKIYDSMKLLNFSVKDIAKAFGLPDEDQKRELDYNTFREVGHELTEEEIKYLRNDVVIMAKALDIMYKEDLNKMTIGSCALSMYKNINLNFSNYFPVLPFEIDEDIRKSYKGGFTYLNPIYEKREIGEGNVYDVNSLYPSVMYDSLLPIGQPIFYEAKYIEDRLYPLYVQTITCAFEVKENMIPTIQLKHSTHFMPNEYISSSNGEIYCLTLTSVDLELFLEHYNVEDLVYVSGWKFKGIAGLFRSYIDIYTKMKIENKKSGNKALYLIAKLMLNSLYGKFGLNPNVQGKYPVLDENGIVRYKLYEQEVRDSIYLPVATFITAYARKKTITTSQKIRDYSLAKYGEDRYVYSDTDSIHTNGLDEDELKDIIDIDDYKLGYWAHEGHFIRGKYIRQKCYIEQMENEDKISTTIAGLPKNLGYKVNFDNFDIGFTTRGKLMYTHTTGGVVLTDTEFTIKEK